MIKIDEFISVVNKFKVCPYCKFHIVHKNETVCIVCETELKLKYQKNQMNVNIDDFIKASLTTKLLEE